MNLSQLNVIGFDIDKTLIFGPEAERFYAQYSRALEAAFARERSLSLDSAKQCLDAYRKKYDGRGELAFDAFGLSQSYVYDAICAVDPSGALPIMAATNALLERLHPHVRLVAITDGPIDQAHRLLAATGIRCEWFSEIIGWRRGGEKPKNGSSAIFCNVIERYGILPEEFLMVGDTHAVDVAPVVAVGAKAIHIGNATESLSSVAELSKLFSIQTL